MVEGKSVDSEKKGSEPYHIAWGARYFVFLIFVLLGLSFIATTAVFIYEFREKDQWLILGVYYSHLFIFFPTFGLIALYAFYLPSVVFVDLYWQHLNLGKLRFTVSTLLIIGLSYGLSSLILAGKLPTIWEIKPQILMQDKNVPPNCSIHNQKLPTVACQRLSIMNAVTHVRDISSHRLGLSKFIRNCQYDNLLPEPLSRNEIRHCFANGQRENAQNCCMAQKRLGEQLLVFKSKASNMSLTGKVHRLLLPLKVFFLLILLIIGALLVWWKWRGILTEYYHQHSRMIEKGILSGVIAMLFWPVTNHAFLQSATVLFGFDYHNDSFFARSAPAFSVIFGLWAIMITLYFMQEREQKEIELLLKGVGVLVSAIAVIKYDLLIDTFVRFAGSGADLYAIIFMIFSLIIVLLPLFSRNNDGQRNSTAKEAAQKDDFLKG